MSEKVVEYLGAANKDFCSTMEKFFSRWPEIVGRTAISFSVCGIKDVQLSDVRMYAYELEFLHPRNYLKQHPEIYGQFLPDDFVDAVSKRVD